MIKKLYHLISTNKKYMVLLDQAVFSGNSFITTLLLTRILGLANFGIYASVILFIYLLISVLNAIIIQPLQVTIASIKDKESYISFSFFLLLIFIIIISGVLFITLSFDITFIKSYDYLMLEIFTLSIGVVIHDYFRKLFLARIEIVKAFIIDFFIAILHISILIAALLFFEFSLSQTLLYVGLGYIPSILISIFFIKPKLVTTAKIKNYLKIHYDQSKWLLMTAILQWWSSNLFVVASGVLLGLEMLGVLRFVQSLFGVLNILLQTFENYLLPQVSKLLVESRQQAKKYIQLTSIKTAIPFVSILAILFVFSKPIIVIAGGVEYGPFDYVVKGMVVLYAFIFIGYPIRMAIRALILNKNFFIGYVISFIFSILFYNYLLEQWQLMGVILGLTISQILVLSYWVYILHKNNFSLWK